MSMITQKKAALFLGVADRTLEDWRYHRKGVVWSLIGGAIRYDEKVLADFQLGGFCGKRGKKKPRLPLVDRGRVPPIAGVLPELSPVKKRSEVQQIKDRFEAKKKATENPKGKKTGYIRDGEGRVRKVFSGR